MRRLRRPALPERHRKGEGKGEGEGHSRLTTYDSQKMGRQPKLPPRVLDHSRDQYFIGIVVASLVLESMTEAVGQHPLFEGIRGVEVAGLAKPSVSVEGETVRLQAPGLSASFRGATLHESFQRVVVTLP